MLELLGIRETVNVRGVLGDVACALYHYCLVPCLRFCQITCCCQQKWQLLFVPSICKMHQWLYSTGGLKIGAKLFSLCPNKMLLQVPIPFADAFGRMLESCQHPRWGMQWLNVACFCSLLSFIISCTACPFTAVVFTCFYAYGATIQCPL